MKQRFLGGPHAHARSCACVCARARVDGVHLGEGVLAGAWVPGLSGGQDGFRNY